MCVIITRVSGSFVTCCYQHKTLLQLTDSRLTLDFVYMSAFLIPLSRCF